MIAALALALIGTLAPDWTGKTVDGRAATLNEVVKEGPAVVLVAPEDGWRAPDGVRILIAPDSVKLLGGQKAALVDASRTIRLTADRPQSLPVADWLRGREIYAAACLRCHGAEGRDDHYAGIKPLAGIGRRLSAKEILERTIRSGSVDMTPFDDEARRALIVWVSGL